MIWFLKSFLKPYLVHIDIFSILFLPYIIFHFHFVLIMFRCSNIAKEKKCVSIYMCMKAKIQFHQNVACARNQKYSARFNQTRSHRTSVCSWKSPLICMSIINFLYLVGGKKNCKERGSKRKNWVASLLLQCVPGIVAFIPKNIEPLIFF